MEQNSKCMGCRHSEARTLHDHFFELWCNEHDEPADLKEGDTCPKYEYEPGAKG